MVTLLLYVILILAHYDIYINTVQEYYEHDPLFFYYHNGHDRRHEYA